MGSSRDWIYKNSKIIIRWAIVIAVLLLSFYLPYHFNFKTAKLLLILVFTTIAAIILIRKPIYGLIALIVASFLIPLSIGTGTKSSVNIAILMVIGLTFLWLIDMLFFKRSLRMHKSRTFLPLLFLSIVTIIAFILGGLPWFGNAPKAPLQAQLGGMALFLLSIAAFFLAAHQITQIKHLEWIVWIFLAISGTLIVLRSLPYGGIIISKATTVGVWGSMLWVWFIALSLSQLLINKSLSSFVKILLMIVLIIAFFQIFIGMRNWASGWLPAFAVLLTVLFFTYPRASIILGIIGLFIAILKFTSIYDTIMSTEEYSAITRWEAWKIILKMIKENPITGFGPANYYAYSILFPILGYYVNFNSHSQYFDLLAQTGILGLICYIWFAAEMLHLGVLLSKQNQNGFSSAYTVGVVAGLIGTLVAGFLGDWVIPFVYNIGLSGFRSSVFPWFFFGGLVAMDIILQNSKNNNTPVPNQ